VSPEIQGVAGLAALEAMEQVLVEVDAERAAGAGAGAVQGAGTALLSAVRAAWSEAEQFEHGVDADGGSGGSTKLMPSWTPGENCLRIRSTSTFANRSHSAIFDKYVAACGMPSA